MKSLYVPALFVLFASVVPALTDSSVAQAQPPVVTPEAGTSSPQATAEAVAKVQAFYDRSTTFKSDFLQKFWVKAYNQEKVSSGTVTFAKPGKMHWNYQNPAGNRVVSNGAVVKVYEAANKQMYEQPVDRSQSQHTAALSFLTGQGRLGDSFNFELYPGERMNFPGGQVLVGTPKVASPSYTKVLFYVDNATSQVRRVMVIDGQGNRNRFDFTAPKINEAVEETHFQFFPPAGTSIIRP